MQACPSPCTMDWQSGYSVVNVLVLWWGLHVLLHVSYGIWLQVSPFVKIPTPLKACRGACPAAEVPL